MGSDMAASPVIDGVGRYREQTFVAVWGSMCFQLHRGEFFASKPAPTLDLCTSPCGSRLAREGAITDDTYPTDKNKNAKRNAWHFL
ncbi:hypothetical protein C1X65_01530 [Pseudomonas sp. FW305-70]|nr:hypothetical protein C1X65_01530 [Pseudomonas sp. FW305-70]